MIVNFPDILALNESLNGNIVRCIAERGILVGALHEFQRKALTTIAFRPIGEDYEILILPHQKYIQSHDKYVIQAPKASLDISDYRHGKWIKHPLHTSDGSFDYDNEINEITASWIGAFSYIKEDDDQKIKGLRNPQIGAVHAIHAHWSVSDDPAIIVMPTGTGKTEVMLSGLISARCEKLLVVVPTDVLRTQLFEKFLTLGILKDPDCDVLDQKARYPIVGVLKHIPETVDDVDDLFERCQVVVTTSMIAGRCSERVQERMSYHCPYLFIDEAHHAEAPTWKTFRERFKGRRVLQFTATPFREDGKLLDGEIIYKYSLKKAQEEDYFMPIRFMPIHIFDKDRADVEMVKKAMTVLQADVTGRQILMARVDGIKRAEEIFKLYAPYVQYRPVQLHTGVRSKAERDTARRQIIEGQSRIVVCVDMLGEGFDLPELKIAAFHDIRKSVAVTLQLAGRFTRKKKDLGDATFIANIADVDVKEELRKLYIHDQDWNALLPSLSDELIGEQVSLKEFLKGFSKLPGGIALGNVSPALSTVVYKTKCKNWKPEKFRAGIPGISSFGQVHHAVNLEKNTIVIITAKSTALPWIDSASLFHWEWELYVLMWSSVQNLLFINCSGNAGEYRGLAQAVAGDEVELIKGQDVFKTFAGVNRLRLQNVGLSEKLGRNIRFTSRMGADVESGLPELAKKRAQKVVLAGIGFKNGRSVSVGASRKGRIWAKQRGNIADLLEWCEQMGNNLLDQEIDPEELLKGTLETKPVSTRPSVMPTVIDWPEEMYKIAENDWVLKFGNQNRRLGEVSIDLIEPGSDGALRFVVSSETEDAEFQIELFQINEVPDYRYSQLNGPKVYIQQGENAKIQSLTEFFYDDPPVIWFEDGSSIEGNQYVELKLEQVLYDSLNIKTWDWADTNLKKESQGKEKDQTSIQARLIRELKAGDYSVIVDDDGKAEIADVVAIRLIGGQDDPKLIETELYHCKAPQGAAVVGKRVKDLYEVCGQAQKCISWLATPERQTGIFTHLLRHEERRVLRSEPTRIEVGDATSLRIIRDISRSRQIKVKVFIVQPGLSRRNVTQDQLQLLGVTENHLMETYQVPFAVIGSE